MEEENLEMGLFGNTADLELNFTDLPEIDEEEIIEDESTEEVEEQEEENNLNEDHTDDSEEVVEEEEDQDEEGEDDNSPNLYSSFASVLNEQGLLPSFDLQTNKVKSLDDLTSVIKTEIESQAKSYLVEKIGEEGYNAIEKGITLQEYQQYQDTVNTLDNITEEIIDADVELQKNIIYEDYISQGINKERAKRILNKTIELNDPELLKEEAKESLNSLKEIQSQKLEKLQNEREAAKQEQLKLQQKIDNDLKNSIYNSKEFIEGIPVSKTIKNQVYNSITKIVSKSPSGIMENQLMKDRRENPIEFDSKLYYLYEITKGFKDFSKLINTSKSKATQDLERELRKNKFETSGTPSYLQDPESYSGLGSELVLD